MLKRAITNFQKLGNCSNCRQQTSNRIGIKWLCDTDCAIALINKAKAKKALQERKIENRAIREGRERNKTRRQWISELQIVFNRFIRLRDILLPCICCGKFGPDESWKTGGSFDAGHYLSVGSHPELRFNEENCHKQLKSCNAGSGKYSHKARTVSQQYRERLIQKIGLDRVEWLEGPHEPRQYTIDELMALKKHYSAKCRELQKQQEKEYMV